jgi:hypothetical protein
MVSMSLIVEVKSFAFLIHIGVKKCGINIKKHVLGALDGINNPAEFTGDLIQLFQCISIHAVSLDLKNAGDIEMVKGI